MYLYPQPQYLYVASRFATSALLIVAYKSRLYHHHIFRLRCSPFRRACAYIIVVEPSLKELGCGLSQQEFPAIRGVYFTSFQSEATIFCFSLNKRNKVNVKLGFICNIIWIFRAKSGTSRNIHHHFYWTISLTRGASYWALRLVIKSNLQLVSTPSIAKQLKLGTGLGMITFPRQHRMAHRFFLRSPNFSISITTESPITNVQGLQLQTRFVHQLAQTLQSTPNCYRIAFYLYFLQLPISSAYFFINRCRSLVDILYSTKVGSISMLCA